MKKKSNEKIIRILNEARPASGYRPETEAEWKRLQAAQVELITEFLHGSGVENNRKKARAVAEMIMGGSAGRTILEIAFSED